jgi:hypothetical protein
MNLHKSHLPWPANWTVDIKIPPTALWLPLKSDLPLKELGRRAAIKVLGEGKPEADLEKFAQVISDHTEDCQRRQVRKGGIVFFPDFNRLPPIATIDVFTEYSQTPPSTLDHYRELYGTPDRNALSPIEMTDVDLPAGPAVRFHSGYWQKSRLPVVIDRPHLHVTYAVRPPAIEDAVLLMVAWTEFKFSEALVNMADAMAQTLEVRLLDA